MVDIWQMTFLHGFLKWKLNKIELQFHWDLVIMVCLLAHTSALVQVMLTDLPQDKMAAIFADENFKCIFLNENDRIPIWVSLKFVPSRPVNNNIGLVQVMACHQIGNKPLPD